MIQTLKTLGGTPVSRFCFGAMQFGSNADHTAAQNMYDACRQTGINFFDTAHTYTNGMSETWLGQLVAPEREDVFVASKVAASGGSGPENILRQFEESRARHRLEVVDALYLHRWDEETPLEETFEALAGLKHRGAVRHIGVSNYAAWQVMKAVAVAEKFDLTIGLLQPMYNLVKRQAEVELLPMAQDQGIAVVPYSPLGGGLLTGKYHDGGGGRLKDDRMYASRYRQDWMHDTAMKLSALAKELEVNAATLAVAWVASNPLVAAPIISARSTVQLEASLNALTLAMDEDLRDRITSLSPTPAPATDRSEEPT